jgi:hypothetical protein
MTVFGISMEQGRQVFAGAKITTADDLGSIHVFTQE